MSLGRWQDRTPFTDKRQTKLNEKYQVLQKEQVKNYRALHLMKLQVMLFTPE